MTLDMEERVAAAVRVIFGGWTCLKLAVENEWGGDNTRGKALQLMQTTILQIANSQAKVHADEVEDFLDQSLVDEFNVEAEDGSPQQVAQLLVTIHREAQNGTSATADELIKRAGDTRTWVDVAPPRAACNDESSDDDDVVDASDGEDVVSMDDVEPAGDVVPILDEDGFQMVTRSGRSRRR